MDPAPPVTPPGVRIDFDAVTGLFAAAAAEGRHFLYEHETYELLKNSGAETPPHTVLLAKGSRPSDADLLALPGDTVVLKIVSPTIVHKTEVSGVRIVPKTPEKIRSAWRRMMVEVPERYAQRIERNSGHAPAPYRGLQGEALPAAVARDIRGVLMAQYLPPDSEAFGSELIVGIRRTREFGMVISAGIGGTDTELYAERFRKGQAVVAASTEMTDGESFFELFRGTLAYRKMAGLTRERRRLVTDEQLIECFGSFIAMANYYSPVHPGAPWVIEELEINPFAFREFLMVPLDGMCRFSPPAAPDPPRPIAKIDRLLHPASIGLVGASAGRVNYGRIILRNILAAGFGAERITLVNPGAGAIEGVRCVPDLDAVAGTLDLLVLSVEASQIPPLVARVIDRGLAHAVLLIPGGIGETERSREAALDLARRIADSHRRGDGGPVFLGSNSLGVISHPGRFDTLFIPEEKLPKQRSERRRSAAFVSQSGAFMITRLSKRPYLDPAYLVSVGNQTDLTLGDLAADLKDRPGLTTLAVYAEGFKDLDGLAFVRAVRAAVLNGMDVVFYKAGRTPEGQTATSGHTASLAGDYMVCESCVRQAGAMVAQTFTQFDALFLLSERLHGKKVRGNRIAALSSAGYEAVGMADRIQSEDYAMRMAALSPESVDAVRAMLRRKRLDALVNVANPLDLNPGADDDVHVETAEILAADPNVDAMVVGIVPFGPTTRTLPGPGPFACTDSESLVQRLPRLVARSDKPIVAVVDAGALFDPVVAHLEAEGVPVFRSSDLALAALGRYIAGRLAAEHLRLRGGLESDA
jgi:acyl-CoA synthetase (NDP forming)